MAFGQTPKDAGGIPIGCVYVPGTGFVALQGSAATNTDGSSNSSAPVVVHRFASVVLNQTSALWTANGNSADLAVGPFAELALDINITGNQGTSPTVQFFLDRKGADSNYYNLWSSSVVSTASMQISTSLGAGMSIAQSFGSTVRFRWAIGGTSSPGYTFSASIVGK